MKTTLSIIFVILAFAVSAQSVEIRGTVKDKTTNKGIPFVNIRLKNSYTGTAANKEGAFILTVPKNSLQDSIVFSCVGYKKRALSVEKAIQNQTIQMEQAVLELPEIVVSSLDAKEILKKAIQRVPQNYHNPVAGTYFYRDWRIVDDTLSVFAEGIFDILHENYGEIPLLDTDPDMETDNEQNSYSVIWQHRLLVYDTSVIQKPDLPVNDKDFLSNYYDLSIFNLLSEPKYLLRDMKRKSDYSLSAFYDADETLFYVVEQRIKKPTYKLMYSVLRYTINTTDYAITHIEASHKIDTKIKILYIPTSIRLQIDSLITINQYEKVNGKYILTLASSFRDMKFSIPEKSSRKLKMDVVYQLTSFDNASIASFPKERAISPKKKTFSDIFTNSTYDESFWQQYHYIPLDEDTKIMIEKYRNKNSP
jgi:hypothetical protein